MRFLSQPDGLRAPDVTCRINAAVACDRPSTAALMATLMTEEHASTF
jgi:hypothetical protein